MKIRCAKDELFERVQMVQRAVSGRSTLPILNNILAEAKGDTLTLVAYDLEFGIEGSLKVNVEAEGGTTIPARVFAEVIGSMPEAEIMIEVDDRQMVTIACGSSHYRIHGLRAEEFPRLPLLTEGATVHIGRLKLRQLIRRTAFESSIDETRPILTGVLTSADGNALSMIATDTHRLAWAEGSLEEPAEVPASAIVPGRIYTELLRILGAVEDDSCEIRICENQAQFHIGHIAVQSRLIDGEFPNWEKVLPKNPETKVTVDVESLRQALRRAAIVAREDANKVVVAAGSDGLTLSADSQEVGTGHEELPAHVDGPDVSIGFNARYLLDALNVVDADEVRLDLRGALESGLLTPVDGEAFKYVLMPMQVS